MNSPDHNSPNNSESSSDNEVEDMAGPPEQSGFAALQPGPGPSGFFGGPPATKRRLPGGLMFSGASRDPKTRRKDVRSGGGGYWDHMGPGPSRGARDDLVDGQIVEQLRQQFGDPFDERDLKGATN